jgi:3-oxoacyl-[acyl-carrier protein] reductase
MAIALAARSSDQLEALARTLPTPALVHETDLREPGAPAALIAATLARFGRLDLLVNNAGATKRGDFLALSDDDWADGFALKFFAHVRLTREAWPLLKAQKGSLITIAGIGGKEPEPPFTIGSSVNAACVAFTKALSDVGKADGVQVNSINPGRVETDRLWRRFRETIQKTGRDEAAVREEFRQEFGRLDILVNNAGATKRGDFFTELTDADWQDGFALKFFAHVRLTREAWPLLKAQHGSMVTIAGIGGKEPEPPFTIGSSVNAACAAFTKALSDIGKADGVQVNSINPGRVETERLWRRFREAMQKTGRDEASVREEYRQEFGLSRFGKVEDLGSFIAFICSPRGRWLHGATIDIDGGEVKSV